MHVGMTPSWLLSIKNLNRYDLTDGMQYNFPLDGVTATYVAEKDRFIPFKVSHRAVVAHSRHGYVDLQHIPPLVSLLLR